VVLWAAPANVQTGASAGRVDLGRRIAAEPSVGRRVPERLCGGPALHWHSQDAIWASDADKSAAGRRAEQGLGRLLHGPSFSGLDKKARRYRYQDSALPTLNNVCAGAWSRWSVGSGWSGGVRSGVGRWLGTRAGCQQAQTKAMTAEQVRRSPRADALRRCAQTKWMGPDCAQSWLARVGW
jgi:hypothetical protein